MQKFVLAALVAALAPYTISVAQLAGTYTVGGESPDFATFQEAADSLMTSGISGPVEIYVRPGVYTSPDSSQRVLNMGGEIPGASETSRIRFAPDASRGGDNSTVVLRRYRGAGEQGFVVNLLSSHVTIEGFSVEVSDTSAATISVPNVVYIGSQSGSGAYTSDSGVDNLIVDGLMRRARRGIEFFEVGVDIFITNSRVKDCVDPIWGQSYRPIDRLQVTGNHVTGMQGHPSTPVGRGDVGLHIRSTAGQDILVADNLLDYAGASGAVGMWIYGDGPLHRLRVEGNKVVNFNNGDSPFGRAGQMLWVANAPGGIIANNFLSGSAIELQGAYLETLNGGDTLSFANNTIRIGGSGKGALTVLRRSDLAPAYVRILNNILISEGSPGGYYSHVYISYMDDLEMDYNAHQWGFGSIGTGFIDTDSGRSTYVDLADWQASGGGTHSTRKRPEFVSDGSDLHLFGSSIGDTDLIGKPLLEVLFDIDGQPRDEVFPYMGADEAAPFPEGQPVARDDNFRTFEETSATLDVLANDFDDQPLKISALSGAGTLGSVSLTGDSLRVQYTPPLAYVGRDRFSYVARDTDGLPADAIVTVDVVAKPADLTVSGITVPPTVFSGQTLSFEFTVTNAGPGATRAPSWFDQVILSATPNAADRVLSSSLRNPTFLDSSDSYTTTAQLQIPDGLEGPHYVLVHTDWLGNQVESDEDNNVQVSGNTVDVALTPPPDLQVTALSVPSTAFSGTTISVSFTVSNEGVGPTGTSSWRDVVYGTDSDGRRSTLASLTQEGALAPGESYARNVPVVIPNAISGRYVITAEADPRRLINFGTSTFDNGDVFEHLLEGNNSLSDSLDVTLSPPPDLVPTAISSPATGSAGAPLAVSWTVENQGAGTPFETSWTDRVYLSEDRTLDAGTDILLGSARQTSRPTPGNSYQGAASPRIPNGLTGSFYVIVVSDANGEVFEHTFEENNVLVSGETLEVTIPPSPDLIVSSVTAPAEAEAGGKVFVAWTVSNVGAATTNGRWVDRVYISNEATYAAGTGTQVGSLACDPCTLDVNASYSTGLEISIAVDRPGGAHYVHVVTDADDALYEHEGNENNIGSSSEIAVAEYPPVDLTIASVSVSADTVAAGAQVTVDWVVQNVGAGTTLSSRWTDRVYLSSDQQLDPAADRLLVERPRLQPLRGNERYERTSTISTPDNVSGVFFLIVETDALNQAPEENDDNNTFVSPSFVIESVPPPDLKPVSFQAPVEAAAGQPITVQWTVQNQGSGATVDPSWFDGIYLSELSSLTPTARRIGTAERAGVLDPDSSYTDSTEVTIPAFASGSQFLLFQADSGGDVFEGPRESNNVLAVRLSIVLNEPSDLVVTSITAPPAAVPGEEITVEYTVTNQGAFEARGFVLDAAYVSTDERWDLQDPLVAIEGGQLVLAPGASQKRSMKVDLGRTFAESSGQIADELPGVLPGDYRILVRTDVRNAIRETEDGNNITAAPTITAVTIDALTLETPANFGLVANQRKYFALTVGSGEDLRLTLTGDNPELANDLYVAFDRVPGPEDFDFGPSAPNEANQEVYVPTTQAGTYYVMVQRRGVGAGTEQLTLLAESLGFTILSITPDQGGARGRVTTTIRGAGFDAATTFELRSGTDVVAAEQVDVINSSLVEARWNLAGAALTQYSAWATKGTAEVELTNAFSVVLPERGRLEIVGSGPELIRERRTVTYNYVVRNVGNIDVEHIVAWLIVPASVSIQRAEFGGDTEVLTFWEAAERIAVRLGESTSIAEQLGASVLVDNFQVETGESPDSLLRVMPFRALALGSGQEFSIKVDLAGFVGDTYAPIEFSVQPATAAEMVSAGLSSVEGFRQILLDSLGTSANQFWRDPDEVASRILPALIGEYDTYGELSKSNAAGKVSGRVTIPSHEIAASAFGSAVTESSAGEILNTCIDAELALCIGVCFAEGFLGVAEGVGLATLSTGGFVAAAAQMELWCVSICTSLAGSAGAAYCNYIFQAWDPNDIIGPAGFGDDRWIAFDDPLPYTIRFENDPVKATAAAQEVFVTQQLDSTLDWRSFRLGEFGFGEWRFQVPENSAFHQTRIDVRDSLGLFVDFIAGIDITTGEAFWRFESVDPLTGELPWFDGFLPPNDTLGRGTGEGFVTYSIKPKATAKTRDIVNAEARIIFDFNEPIDTPPIFNTIDAEPPMSMVQPLSAVTDTSNFPVSWSLDDFGGSDAREFTLYASENGGPFEVFRSGIADTSAVFVGDYDKDYSFFVVATDNTGNAEALKTEAEASTAVARPVGTEDQELPKEFALYQNYPNPFNPATTIPFDIAKAGEVEITVYDVIGRRVLRADQGSLSPGRYRAAFNLSHLASGVYVYRILVRGDSRKLFEAVNKFVLVK